MSTLRQCIDEGYTIWASHEVLGDQQCTHSARLDLLDLERQPSLAKGEGQDVDHRHATG